jgi:hypothetical protein
MPIDLRLAYLTTKTRICHHRFTRRDAARVPLAGELENRDGLVLLLGAGERDSQPDPGR